MCMDVLPEYMSTCNSHVPGTREGQKRHWIPQELKLPTSVSHHIGAGNKPQSSGRVISVLNHLAIAP